MPILIGWHTLHVRGTDADKPIDWSGDDEPRKPSRWRRSARGLLIALGIFIGVIVVASVIYKVQFENFYIPSAANSPTLQPGDHVLVEKGAGASRGQVIVFTPPAQVGLPTVISRVIAVGGDRISAQNGVVYLNGRPDAESYLPSGTHTGDFPETVVPKGEVFVMGDNRSDSSDSRVYGPIPVSSILGHAVMRDWPIGRIGSV